MNNSFDIIIIGSGVIGSSIAYHLSDRRKKEILVIDKGFPLSGTSGATQAWVWIHSKTPNWYAELNMYSAELYPFLEKKIGDVEYQRTGGIDPFFFDDDRESALNLAEEQAEVGIKIDVLTRDEALEKEPALSPKIAGATFSSLDGNVNPFRLVELYVKAAKKNHVKFSFYNRVIDIIKGQGKFTIATEQGEFTSKQVILAGGPWSKEIGALLNVDIPVSQIRGQIIVTEPLTPLIKHTMGVMRQANNGEVLIGYSEEKVGFDRRSTLDVIQETARMAINYVPDLAKANVVRCFSGIRVVPEDELPIIGEIPDVENAFIACLHSGVTLSPLIGTLMTELIMDGQTSLPIDRYRLNRF